MISIVFSSLIIHEFYKQHVASLFAEMLEIFIDLSVNPSSWLPKDSNLVTSIIQLVISGAQCQVLQNTKLFEFFSQVFKDAR
jgi:ferritin-like protein